VVRVALMAVVITVALVTPPVWGRGPLGRPDPPTKAECTAARCTITQAVADTCPCDAAVSHRSHVKCVSRAVKDLLVAHALPTACKGAIVRCAARSTCGKPGATTCRITASGETERCRVRTSAARCEARGGTLGAGTCCASCPTTTTSSTTSTTTLESSTTTTTLIPCGGLFPACLGSCPPGETCTAGAPLDPCVCVPTGP
jgi:hypothetical protein